MPSKSKKAKSTQTGGLIPRPTLPSTKASKPPQPAPQFQPEPEYEDEPLPLPHDSEIRAGDTTESAGEQMPMPAVNRKKQKRRDKEAAKRLAQQQQLQHQRQPQTGTNGHMPSSYYPQENGQQVNALKQGRGPVKGYFTEEPDYVDPDFENDLVEEDEEFYSNEDAYSQGYTPGPENSWLNTSKRKKNSKRRTRPLPVQHSSSNLQRPFPTLSNAALRSAHKMSNANDHIWNTSTQAERENIKQFWLELGEQERRSLVRVEKEAVLRKMKEQQKHSCSCSVCGRKRTAIEEELEVLYDAYYRELEQFANHDEHIPGSPRHMPPPLPRVPSNYRSNVNAHPMAGAYPEQGRIHELDDEDDEDDLQDEDDYDDEEEDDEEDEYSDEYDDDLPPGPADFFHFGNSLTVKDGILTVADDLLKNDGKHFIEMMEQLAERRMQREEELLYPVPPLAHHDSRQGHNHPPTDEDEEYDDEEDEEDYDSQEEDDYDGDDMDSMTEEQRMEEGRRMFQIFAARMFEQRVLTAYKEKVAAERQKKLLEELDAEEDQSVQREAKKAKDAAKKKEKKARQKAAKDEEKAKRDAEKAAAEAAVKEAEEKKAAAKRAKQEELRKKREAERKAAEDEKIRKEAERVARLAKDRERQQEAERKVREAKDREKKQREEQRMKERQEKEAKEAEAREKRAQEERARKEREQQQRKEKEAAARAEGEAKDRQKAEHASRPAPVVLPPGLATVSRNMQTQAATVQAVTPTVVSALPVQNRSRQVSQPSQHSVSSSPRSQKTSTEVSQTSGSPANVPTGPQAMSNTNTNANANTFASKPRQQPQAQHPQPPAPRSPLSSLGSGNVARGQGFTSNYGNVQGTGVEHPTLNGPPGHLPMSAPMHMFNSQTMSNQHYRMPQNGMSYPPGFNGARPLYQTTQHMPYVPSAPAAPIGQPAMSNVTNHMTHSRQHSGSETTSILQPAPIARPGPIARPSSTTPDKQHIQQDQSNADVEKVATQLGSSALLDDSDAPFVGQLDPNRYRVARGPSRNLPYAPIPDKSGPFGLNNTKWPLVNARDPMAARFPAVPGGMMSNWLAPKQYDHISPGPGVKRPQITRPVAVRLILIQAIRNLAAILGGTTDQWYSAHQLLQQAERLQMANDPVITMDDILMIAETEGNVQNGGGIFETMNDPARGQLIKWIEDKKIGLEGPRQQRGEIGGPEPRPIPAPIAAPGSIQPGTIGQGAQYGMHAFRGGPPGRHF